MGTGVLIVGSKWPLGSFKPPFPLGGNEGRGWASQGEGLDISSSRGSCPGSRGLACPSTASLCGPDVAQALPAQAASLSALTKAPQSSGQGPEEDYADSLMGKIGSWPEEQQGRSPRRVSWRAWGSRWHCGSLGWGRCCGQSRV